MSPRSSQGGGLTGEKKLVSSLGVLFRIDLYRGRLTADRTRSHGVSRAPKVRWQNKYLLPGISALVIYGIMRLRLCVPFVLLLATAATKPVVGQCPSYTDYSKVETLWILFYTGIDVMSPGPSWNAVQWSTRSPIYAAGPRMQNLHESRGGSKSVVHDIRCVAKRRARTLSAS